MPHKECTCGITPSMTYFELRALGSGCTSVGVCPVLDKRRRSVRQPTDAERAADDLRLHKEQQALAEKNA